VTRESPPPVPNGFFFADLPTSFVPERALRRPAESTAAGPSTPVAGNAPTAGADAPLNPVRTGSRRPRDPIVLAALAALVGGAIGGAIVGTLRGGVPSS